MITFFHIIDIILHDHGGECSDERVTVGGVRGEVPERRGLRPGHFPALRTAEEAHGDRSRNHCACTAHPAL